MKIGPTIAVNNKIELENYSDITVYNYEVESKNTDVQPYIVNE